MSRFLSFLRLSFSIIPALVGLGAARAADPIPADWFVWPMVEPLAGSALDSSSLNPEGRQGLSRIKVSGDHFVTPDGKRMRFWGANLCQAVPETTLIGASSKARNSRISPRVLLVCSTISRWYGSPGNLSA